MHAQVLKETAASSPAGTPPATASGGAAAATPVPLRLSPAGTPSQVNHEARSCPVVNGSMILPALACSLHLDACTHICCAAAGCRC